MPIIEFRNVDKYFPRLRGQVLIRKHIAQLFTGGHKERFYALKNVSFQVHSGESLAVIGPNGAGKSTLLGLMAGLAAPNGGEIIIDGRVAALLELGSGFHYDLTGAENVRLNAALLGLKRREAEKRFGEIVEFSGIGEFINEPLRTYSSGMMMRLAFSVAMNVDPDILLIDEILAVGDQAFQTKCSERMREFRRQGKTIICVSHAMPMIQVLCDRAIWLDRGEIVRSGQVDGVVKAYVTGVRQSAQSA
jgi:ABC-type polysaccharide/polyol phosphate transport system ATPase subunit